MIDGSEPARGANPFLSSNEYATGPVSFSANPGGSGGNPVSGQTNTISRVPIDENGQSSSNMPVKYRIASSQTTNAFTITLLVPKSKDPPGDRVCPFRKVQDSTPNKPGRESHIFHISMSQLLAQAQSLSVANTPRWLDSPTLRKRLSEGGNAVGLDSHQIYQSIAAVEESVARVPSWIPDRTESVNVDIYLAEGLISIIAIVSPPTQAVGGLDFSFTSFQSKSESISLNQNSGDTRMSIFSSNQGEIFQRPDTTNGLFGQHSSSFDSWMATGGDSRMNFAKDLNTNANNLFQNQNLYQGSGSDRPVPADHLFGGPELHSFTNTFENTTQTNDVVSTKRPSPSSIIEPLLSMGFTSAECDAAVSAIQNLSMANNFKNPPGYDDLLSHGLSDKGVDTIGGLNSQLFGSTSRGILDSSEPRQELDKNIIEHDNKKTGPVWGNAGKLKVVKSTGADEDPNSVVNEESGSISASSIADAQPQKLVKVLDIPPEMNAFVFHCNSNTREESLQRCLFGCPSGGQYGPHSKAKKGDLLFLADFSSWTVTGIFVAKSDAQLNIDKTAWNGRFPWQIRVEPSSELKTIHIDKVNEIIGLTSGSKLNMLTKEQLLQLVGSKEFGASVPPNLYKMKSVPQSQKMAQVKDSPVMPPTSDSVGMTGGHLNTNVQGIKYGKVGTSSTLLEEHPATAMRRLRLVTSWFDSFAGEILYINEILNGKKPSTKKESTKEKVEAEGGETFRNLRKRTDLFWGPMSYTYIRRAIADVFDQWLLYVHSVYEENNENVEKTEGNDWTQQRKSAASSSKSDSLLLSRVPGSKAYIKELLCFNSGTSALFVPEDLAELLATNFLRDIENISQEVRKTQISLVKIGGDDYLKSISAKSLGMKVVESDKQLDSQDRPLVRIEWHTKSSIAQGRPPQVQKIYKDQFNSLAKAYKATNAVDDPSMSHFLPRLFVLLCRYDLIGDVKNRCQAILPSNALKAMSTHFGAAHECFSSPFNHEYSSFTSTLFADTDKYFGSVGSFFDLIPVEGSYQVNPPFSGSTMNLLFDRLIGLLKDADRGQRPLSFLIVVRGDDSFDQLQRSHFCRRITSVEIDSKFTVNTQHKDTVSASRKQMKTDNINTVECSGAWSAATLTSLIWFQTDKANAIWTPTDDKVDQVVQGFQNESFYHS